MSRLTTLQMVKNTEFSPSAASFSMRLRLLRTESRGTSHAGRMTNTDAATLCGVSPSQWTNLESGKFTPFPDLVFHIEKCFELEPGTLSCLLGYTPVTPVNFEIGKFDPIISQLSNDIRVYLFKMGVTTSEQLVNMTEHDIYFGGSHIGHASINKIKELLALNGMKLAEEVVDPIMSQVDSATRNSLLRIGVHESSKLIKMSRKDIYSNCSHIGAVRLARLEEILSANGMQLSED